MGGGFRRTTRRPSSPSAAASAAACGALRVGLRQCGYGMPVRGLQWTANHNSFVSKRLFDPDDADLRALRGAGGSMKATGA